MDAVVALLTGHVGGAASRWRFRPAALVAVCALALALAVPTGSTLRSFLTASAVTLLLLNLAALVWVQVRRQPASDTPAGARPITRTESRAALVFVGTVVGLVALLMVRYPGLLRWIALAMPVAACAWVVLAARQAVDAARRRRADVDR